MKIVEKLLRACEGRVVKRLEGIAAQVNAIEEDVVERLAVLEALPELVRLGPQLGVGEALEVLLDGVDLGRDALQPAEGLALTGAQQTLDH